MGKIWRPLVVMAAFVAIVMLLFIPYIYLIYNNKLDWFVPYAFGAANCAVICVLLRLIVKNGKKLDD